MAVTPSATTPIRVRAAGLRVFDVSNPALVYNYDTSSRPLRQLNFAQFNEVSRNIETVAGAPAISHVASCKLYVVVKAGASAVFS